MALIKFSINFYRESLSVSKIYIFLLLFCLILQVRASTSIALEQYDRAVLLPSGSEEQKDALRQTIALDPKLIDAYLTLSSILINEREMGESEKLVRTALNIQPTSAEAHKLMGIILTSQGKDESAEVELKTALKFDQKDPEIFMGLGGIHFRHARYTDARHELTTALKLNPNGRFVPAANAMLAVIKTMPAFEATLVLPRQYTAKELDEKLREKLLPAEQQLVVNPLASDSNMKQWANDFSQTMTNDLEKAEKLFNVMMQHIAQNQNNVYQQRVARDVFKNWNMPSASFNCQECAHLYVALARDMGLMANVVFVYEAQNGGKAWHECAAVSAGNRILLVDPMYRWFGIPHKQFSILDDIQSIAIYLSSSPSIDARKVAAKLSPKLVPVQVNLLLAFVSEGDWDNASCVYRKLLKLDIDTWLSDCLRAIFCLHDGQTEKATDLLRDCIDLNPYSGIAYITLGDIFFRKKEWVEAQKNYHNSKKCLLDEQQFAYVGGVLKQINQIAENYYRDGISAQDSHWNQALTNYTKAIELNPDCADAYFGRAVVSQKKGNFDAALLDLNHAIAINTNFAKAYGNRGYLKENDGNLDGAYIDYKMAINLDPNLKWQIANLLTNLADAYYSRHDETNALRCLHDAEQVAR